MKEMGLSSEGKHFLFNVSASLNTGCISEESMCITCSLKMNVEFKHAVSGSIVISRWSCSKLLENSRDFTKFHSGSSA